MLNKERSFTYDCWVGFVTVDGLSDCSDQDFIELNCSMLIVLSQQTQQMPYITSHLWRTFV